MGGAFGQWSRGQVRFPTATTRGRSFTALEATDFFPSPLLLVTIDEVGEWNVCARDHWPMPAWMHMDTSTWWPGPPWPHLRTAYAYTSRYLKRLYRYQRCTDLPAGMPAPVCEKVLAHRPMRR